MTVERILTQKEEQVRARYPRAVLREVPNLSEGEWTAYEKALANGYRSIPGFGARELSAPDGREALTKSLSRFESDGGEWCPQRAFFLFDEERFVGQVKLRDEIEWCPLAREFAGHVSYSIEKACRGKGYSTLLLSLMLDEACFSGVRRVELGIADDNAASKATAAACGAVQKGPSNPPGRWGHHPWTAFEIEIKELTPKPKGVKP